MSRHGVVGILSRNKNLNLDNRQNRIYKDCLNNFEAECLTEFDYNVTASDLSKKIFAIKTNQDWLAHFAKQSRFRAQLQKLGLNSTQSFKLHLVFHQFYHTLLRLAPELEEKYFKLKNDAHLTKQTQIYCAQIRIG